MNLYHLRYFVTLAHLEHYTRAAEVLQITQPSLSHAIAALEEELGVQLFEKSGRNIVLTKCGQSFLTEVESALLILDSSVNNLKMTGNGEGIIELAFLRTLGTDLVPTLIQDFLALHPDRNIRFNFSSAGGLSTDILEGLESKKYDIAFCSKLDNHPLIEFVPIATQELVVITPPDHPLATLESVRLEETLAYPQIIFKSRSGLRHIIDGLFAKINARPDAVFEVSEDQVIAGFVAHGFGIAVVPRMQILKTMDVKVLTIESPQWERVFYVATLKDSYRAPVVEAFRQFAIDSARL